MKFRIPEEINFIEEEFIRTGVVPDGGHTKPTPEPEPKPTEYDPVKLMKLTKAELVEKAKSEGIELPTRITKAKIVDLIMG
jgi:hypothetical protein